LAQHPKQTFSINLLSIVAQSGCGGQNYQGASLWLDAVLRLAEARAIAGRGRVWYDGYGKARKPMSLLEQEGLENQQGQVSSEPD